MHAGIARQRSRAGIPRVAGMRRDAQGDGTSRARRFLESLSLIHI
ncbi:MAG: hypothetical protein QUU85_15400 [Candidatus Eisenbacteria bacterium]|nr:hypothetical protein [Candidatus Eisenbacteria bacterium]